MTSKRPLRILKKLAIAAFLLFALVALFLAAFVYNPFEGNLVERGAGNLGTAGSGTVAGNSEHELPGTCSNTVRDFQGAICNLL